ncbi:DUF928 domain-containing protein [Scytonema tolypothrichoides VB-61278]|nr:DUF928 domain-containing protein [Scytonema tolypothrichoides VB-61278]
MKWMIIIPLILNSVIYYPAKVTAQTQQATTTKQPVQQTKGGTSPQQRTSRPVFVFPKTPARLSPVSGRRSGMGSRADNCPALLTALAALVPLPEEQKVSKQTDKSISGIVEGVNTSERPTFWFYVPYTRDLTASTHWRKSCTHIATQFLPSV